MRRQILAFVLIGVAVLAAVGYGSGEDKRTEVVELEETLGFSRDGILDRQGQVEERIDDCMTAQGFRYEPVDPFAQQEALTGSKHLSDDDFTKRFGYGISTLIGRAPDQADPNAPIRRELTPTDRAAYDRVLWGETPGATFAEAVDSGEFGDLGGCTKRATEAVFGGARVLSELVAKLDVLDDTILEDERMVRANDRWSRCMSRRGLRYTDPEEIDGAIEKRLERIVDAEAGTGYDREALVALQEREVEIANADLECERQEITPVELIVRTQYERVFREQNRGCSCKAGRPGGSRCEFVVHEARLAATLACELR